MSFCSICLDLHDVHTSAPLQATLAYFAPFRNLRWNFLMLQKFRENVTHFNFQIVILCWIFDRILSEVSKIPEDYRMSAYFGEVSRLFLFLNSRKLQTQTFRDVANIEWTNGIFPSSPSWTDVFKIQFSFFFPFFRLDWSITRKSGSMVYCLQKIPLPLSPLGGFSRSEDARSRWITSG